MEPTAEALHRRAVEQSIRGRYALAERTLDRAAARAEEPDLTARIMGTRAVVLQNTGQPERAERICRQAMALPGLSASTRAVLGGQLGALALLRGRLHDAERLLSAAIASLAGGHGADRADLTGDRVAEARVRMNRSVVRLQLRDLAGAADDLDRAARIFTAAGLTVDGGQAQHNRAYVALLQGDLIAALRGMQQARPAAAASPVASGICDTDRAEVLRDAGLIRDAERLLISTAAVFGAHRMPQSRAEAEFHLATSQLTHDPERAMRTAAGAMRRFRALGNATWAARADAVRMRAILSGGAVARGGGRVPDSGRVPTAAQVQAVASDLVTRGFAGEAAALRMRLAIWQARHGDADQVGTIRIPPAGTVQVRLLAHEARAARAAARGSLAQARRHAAAGLDALAGWRESFGSLDLQTSIAMHGSGLILSGLDAAVRSNRPDVIFEWSERARHLSQQGVPLRPPADPELAADLAELRMLRADDPQWMSTPRAAELRERARARQWAQTGAGAVYPHLTLDELVGTLDESTALITYVYSGDALTALVATTQRRQIVPLPGAPGARALMPGLRADLDMAAAVGAGPMAAVVRRSLQARLQVLSAELLEEPLAIVGSRRIVITAPGILSGIPWAMLPALRGRPFTLANSATQWVHTRTAARPLGTIGFVAGPRVARGDEEVSAAASAWHDATIVRGGDATVDAVTGLAARLDVLHVAAHGQHAVDNPMFSGLELVDGALFGYDIDRIPQVPAVVVLSACEGGRSSVRWGEEAIGMARVWLSAGAGCVIATPVVVADGAACELLGAMHTGLAAGVAPAEALAAASERTGLVTPFQVHGAGF
ncbi:CHAT domain-containing protein [Microbacterium kribbense]|uniref:CHAT domain-containing protein n=1 Tax=Microbacterium kribbense TaxID=433645 RepID=A0ABP7GSG9_9MICO